MKLKTVRFLTEADNTQAVAPKVKVKKAKKVAAEPAMTGSISKRGSLVFSQKVADALGMTTAKYFRVGVPDGKKKLTAIYLIAAGDDQTNTFPVQKVGRGYGIGLGVVLAKGGIAYRASKHKFTIKTVPVDAAGSTAFELRFQGPPAPPVEGAKRRGRPRKVQVEA